MPKGTRFNSERMFFTDEKTGAGIIRLTSFPAMRECLNYSFTDDGNVLIFLEKLHLDRFAPFHIFRVSTDGTDLAQVTEGEFGGPFIPRGQNCVYYTQNGMLKKTDLNTLEDTEISPLPDEVECGYAGPAGMTDDGKMYVAMTAKPLKSGRFGIVRIMTDGSRGQIAFESPHPMVCAHLEPSKGETVAFHTAPDETGRNICAVNTDGSGFRRVGLIHGNGHWMWLGSSNKIVSCTDFNYLKGISICGPDDEKQTVLSDEHCYWHCGASADGRYIISDTNWPDTGLVIISAKTGKSAVVCYPHATNGHPQWSHCHPFMNYDGGMAVYKTDVNGIPNMHIVNIPVKMREKIDS